MKEIRGGTISKTRITLAGLLVIATAFVVGISVDALNSQLLNSLPNFTDSFEDVQITDGQTPMADQDVKTNKTTISKTVKLKNKSKKSYTKTLPDNVSTKTTVKEDGENLVVADIRTKVSTKEKYTKKKKTKTVTVTTTKTTVTTTYPIEGSANEDVRTSTNTSSKTVKLKKKSKKTYSQKLPKAVSTNTTVKVQGSNMVQTDKIVETETTEKYTKKKKTKTVISTVTTTVITSTYAMKHTEPETAAETSAAEGQPETAEQPATEAATPTDNEAADLGTAATEAEGEQPDATETPEEPEQPAVTENSGEEQPAAAEEPTEEPADTPSNDTAPALPEGKSAIKTAAPKADEAVLSAFESLEFTFKVDAGFSSTGVFDARKRHIVLRYNDDNVYHELGHFLAFIANNYDLTSAFGEIYKQEKSLYKGRNSVYVLSSASEYFAESYRNYVLDKSKLKAERPQTYEAIETALAKITDAQVSRLKRVYGVIWNS